MTVQQFISKITGRRNRHEQIFWRESKVPKSIGTPAERTENQNKMLLNYLKRGWSVTPIDAMELFGILRLGARVWDLRRKGHAISTTLVRDKNKRYASYKLIKS